jgi:PKD repeat protein
MAFADLDNDGKTETVWSYGIVDADLFNQNKFNPEAYKTYVVVLGSNGSILSRPFEIQGYLPNKLAIGNLGGERLKVVLALSDTWPTTYNGQKLVAFDYLGNGGFNINLSDYNYIITDLLAGNIDSDGKTEVIVTHRPRWWDRMDSGVLVYGNEGILKRSIPLPTFGETDMFYNAALTDFDGDGSVDIALQSDYIGKNYNGRQTRIFILSLGGSYSEEKMDWPMETHDYQRTSAYGKRANAAPRIISFSGPANITANQGADFGWTAIDYNGDDLSWAIAWGDGASVEMNCPAGAGCSQFNASYKWLIPGNYTINATVTDGHGGVARKIYQVQVGGGSANRAPVITGIKGPSVLNASQAGVWRVSAYDPENGSLSFDVVWGDEPKKARDAATDKTKAMNVSFSHIYYDAGTYTVQFTVTDEEGASAYANATVLVAPAISNSPPVIETCTLPTSIVANQSASIGCVASDPDGNEDIGNWTVAWGDGSGGAYGCAMGAICNTFSETHTWSMPGDYGVTISVSDRHGASNATTFQVQVSAKIATECPKSAVPESCTSGYDLYAYEQFGYTDKNGCVVYGCGERNSEE